MTYPELSRVTFNRFDMGAAAADMLMQVLGDPQAACPSTCMRFPVHHGATLLGPDVHQLGRDESTQLLLERIADPLVSTPWKPAFNSVAHKLASHRQSALDR